MKILICEDNVIVAMNLEMMIEDLGHVSGGLVTSSVDCLRVCETEAPDLVLVDLDLVDGPTGLGLVDRLNEIGIPSIIVSGQAETLGDDHGAFRALVKPVDEARLGRAIADLAEHRESIGSAT